TTALLLPAVFVAHATGARRRRLGILDRDPWVAGAVALLTFALTSPYLFLRIDTLARDVANQALHLTAGHFGQRVTPLDYVTRVLAPGMGWPAFLLSLSGLGWAAWRQRGAWRVLAACLIPYYLSLALLRTQFPRYALP